MREDLTESEMIGDISFEFFTKMLSPEQAAVLCMILERINGVRQVRRTIRGVVQERRTGVPSQVRTDTFTVTVGTSPQYFDGLHRDVIIRAHTFQISGI